jgi:hypothetical protein
MMANMIFNGTFPTYSYPRDALRKLVEQFGKLENERNEYKALVQFLIQRRLGGKVEIQLQEINAVDPRMELSIVLREGLIVVELVPRKKKDET